MIDDFRLWGSSRCRRMGETATTWQCSPSRFTFSTTPTLLSQRAFPLAAVVGDFPETPHWTRNDKHFPRPLRKNEARLRLAGPPTVRRNGAPHERGDGGESDPHFFVAGAPSERVSRFTSQFTVNPLHGGRSHHRDPSGKAILLKSRTQVVLLNLALMAAGLRTWFSPWLPFSEVALLALARATDPYRHTRIAGVHIAAPTECVRRRPGVYNLSYGRRR